MQLKIDAYALLSDHDHFGVIVSRQRQIIPEPNFSKIYTMSSKAGTRQSIPDLPSRCRAEDFASPPPESDISLAAALSSSNKSPDLIAPKRSIQPSQERAQEYIIIDLTLDGDEEDILTKPNHIQEQKPSRKSPKIEVPQTSSRATILDYNQKIIVPTPASTRPKKLPRVNRIWIQWLKEKLAKSERDEERLPTRVAVARSKKRAKPPLRHPRDYRKGRYERFLVFLSPVQLSRHCLEDFRAMACYSSNWSRCGYRTGLNLAVLPI